jgi:Flp pilus assembly protein TadG
MKRQHLRAQALVEFALILPIALFLILGFLDLGRAIFNYATISNMVREGARYAIVDSTAAGTNNTDPPYQETIARINYFAFSLPKVDTTPTNMPCFTKDTTGQDATCTFTGEDIIIDITRIWNGKSYENIQVEATFAFKPVTPFIAHLLAGAPSIDLVARSTMRLSGSVR